MGHSDDDSDCAEYGTALEPIEEDDVARKRPITVAEQVAVDERGRRRFHGAFTGGFSAGYFNTVGSKEGWAPSTFKSSRSDRGSFKNQNALDFMDDEDKGSFGIAPQVIRPTDDFSDRNEARGKKRPFSNQTEGPIPGVPVLEQIIQPVKETIGIKILIKMGWRPGKGVGPKLDSRTKKAKMTKTIPKPQLVEQTEDELVTIDDFEQGPAQGGRIYGCLLPPEFARAGHDSEDSSDDIIGAEELLAPDDTSALFCNPKENTFGLGYRGLDRNTLTAASDHVDLFGTKLKFRVENKNMSISGEAFGVGAFEDNDDDIYSREDMSQYDFALETPEERKRRKAKEAQEKRKSKSRDNCIDGFKISNGAIQKIRVFPPPPLPPNFQPFHAEKKSRFETDEAAEEKQDFIVKGLGRHSFTISERQVLIEDDPLNLPTRKVDSIQTPIVLERNEDENKPAAPPPDQSDIQRRIDRLKKFTQVLQAYKKPEESERASFKPFMKNPEKQERYEKYLTLVDAGFSECLRDLQPREMTEWEREREKHEFERASKLYKPMSSILSNRFTSAKSHDISHLEPEKEIAVEKDPNDDPKVAAQMKLFGRLTHRVVEWHPDKLVSKRFNVAHPYPDSKFVGVKGDPALRQSIVTKVQSAVTQPVNSKSVQKKSLFDNLDFSKPPPGLLPQHSEQTASSTETPTESSGEAAEDSQTNQVLEFQKEMSKTTASLDNDENGPSEKPPLDLFKEIFADSSDSEEEETQTTLGSTSKINQGTENESQRFISQHMLHGDSERDDKAFDKTMSRSNDRKPLPTEIESVNPKVSSKPGIFDRLNLDRLRMQGHEQNLVINKRHSELADKDGSNEEDMEELDDTYGPLPPRTRSTPTLQHNSHASANSSLKHAATIPSSSGPMNYKSQYTSDDKRKELNNIEEVIWVEKSALSKDSSKSQEKSKKHSSKKSRRKSNKKEKRKSHKGKKHKHKKKSHKHKTKSRRDSSNSESSSESEADLSGSGASSDSSVTINDSLDNRALLAKLKQITRSN